MQPYTRVGLVEDIREFALDVATVFDHFFVGIDELDKMHDSDDVRSFLRGIKGIFSIEGVSYVLTVSEEAVSNFDLRNLAGRDELDSSFREIIKVDALDAEQCQKVLGDRGANFPEETGRMLAIVSGGNSRELLRTAGIFHNWREQNDCSDCDSDYRNDQVGYLTHMAHREVEDLIASVRRLRFREIPKEEIIYALRSAAESGLQGSNSLKVVDLMRRIQHLPFSGIDSGRRWSIDGQQAHSPNTTDENDSALNDRRIDEIKVAEQLESASIRTLIRIKAWKALGRQARSAVFSSDDEAEEWRKLVVLIASSPLEGEKLLETL